MNRSIAQVSLLVKDYDEAIDFYTKVLDFELITDQRMSESKRWVIVRPKGEGGCALLLAKAVGEMQQKAIGNQSGGRVFLFLNTDNFDRDFSRLKSHSVKIIRGPSDEDYGRVAVFEDLYGNWWDLIQPKVVGEEHQ